MKLYQISQELEMLLGSDEDGEMTDETAAALDSLTLAFEVKAENLLQARQGILADAEAIMEESKRLKARADALTRKAEWMRNYLHQNMLRLGLGKVSTTTFTASVAKSPPRVEVENADAIPKVFLFEKKETCVDRALILATYRETSIIPPGVNITSGTNLRIS